MRANDKYILTFIIIVVVVICLSMLLYKINGEYKSNNINEQIAEIWINEALSKMAGGLDTNTIKAEVRYNGKYFIVKNQDDFAWYDVKFKANKKQVIQNTSINPGDIIEIPAIQFGINDVKYFGEFVISCRKPENRMDFPTGMWIGNFK